jgi:hypothetical protein
MLSGVFAGSIHYPLSGYGVVRAPILGETDMTRFSRFLNGAALGVVVLASSPALAATGSGSGRAIIIQKFEFIRVDDLQFGTIVAGSSPGAVTIDAVSGARSSTGGVVAMAGSVQRGRFVGAGEPNQTVTLTLSAPPTLTSGSDQMTVSSLDLDGPTTRTIGPDLAFDVYVDGTLQVGGSGSWLLQRDFRSDRRI